MNRISLDLELERPNSENQCKDSQLTEERIIQVGYVIFDDITGEHLKEVCREVNIRVPLSSFIKKLTGISDEQISNGTDLHNIITELHKDRSQFDASRKLLTWGSGDQECILKELVRFDWKFGRSALNVKHLFQTWAEANDISSSGGLKKSMNKIGIKFEGTAHNALTDAINTAKIFMVLKNKLKDAK